MNSIHFFIIKLVFWIEFSLLLSILLIEPLLEIIHMIIIILVASLKSLDQIVVIIVVVYFCKLVLVAWSWVVVALAIVVPSELILPIQVKVVAIWVIEV